MRIGVVGALGKIGQMRVRTVLDNPDTELAAVHDISAGRAAPQARNAPAFDDIDDFYATPMDAVIVSVPAHVREPICMKAFEAGLHVLSEKPLSTSVDSARRIVGAAKAAGRVLGGGFNMRYYPAFRFVKDVVQSGGIGTLDHVRVYGGHEGLTKFVHDWEYRSDVSGGGALWDVGIHMTDLARHVLGEITEVCGLTSEKVWGIPGSEDNALAIFRSPSGVPAIYQATWNDWTGYESRIEVFGDRGMVMGRYAPMETLLVTQEKPGAPRTFKRNRYLDIMVREKLWSWKSTALRSFAEELVDFVALAGGARNLRVSDGHAALRAIEVARAVRESGGAGTPVRLAELGEMA